MTFLRKTRPSVAVDRYFEAAFKYFYNKNISQVSFIEDEIKVIQFLSIFFSFVYLFFVFCVTFCFAPIFCYFGPFFICSLILLVRTPFDLLIFIRCENKLYSKKLC
mgnify:CR=1 FL=1